MTHLHRFSIVVKLQPKLSNFLRRYVLRSLCIRIFAKPLCAIDRCRSSKKLINLGLTVAENIMTIDRRKTYDSYHFGFSLELTDWYFQHLIKLFQKPSTISNSILGGRRSVLLRVTSAVSAWSMGPTPWHSAWAWWASCGWHPWSTCSTP